MAAENYREVIRHYEDSLWNLITWARYTKNMHALNLIWFLLHDDELSNAKLRDNLMQLGGYCLELYCCFDGRSSEWKNVIIKCLPLFKEIQVNTTSESENDGFVLLQYKRLLKRIDAIINLESYFSKITASEASNEEQGSGDKDEATGSEQKFIIGGRRSAF